MTDFLKALHEAIKQNEASIEAGPRPCLSCGRPYDEHSCALRMAWESDPKTTWYTRGSGERCPTDPTNEDAIYQDPDVFEEGS